MHCKNFTNSTYAPAAYLRDTTLEGIRADIEKVARYIKLDKIYLEPHRTEVLVEKSKIEAIKALFQEYGYTVAGGITTTVAGTLMGSVCYTNEAQRQAIGDAMAYTAELFDEIIIDDFYFTNCRCESCIEAKGERDWASFRLELMREFSENVMIKRAKEANPNVKVVIKFPNWYESFPGCGYNLADETKLFDSIFTGTETRDPHFTHQNLQRYLSYFLPRFTERISGGRNGGGWHDLFECDLEDYIQQIALTLFAKCRESMHFCFPLMAKWPAAYMAAAGAVSDEIDAFYDKLGSPKGIAVYKPLNSNKERHLYDLIGMLGIPLDPYPDYPTEEKVVFLNESAAADGEIIGKMKQTLLSGGKVLVTAALYSALEERGIRDILPLDITGKVAVSDTFEVCKFPQNFTHFAMASAPIAMKHIAYNTNDMWVLSSATEAFYSHPFLLRSSYGKGSFYVVNIPDSPVDMYKLPPEVLTSLRGELDLPITLECGARIGLFLYDNDTFIIHSFRDRPEHVLVRIDRPGAKLTQLYGIGAAEEARCKKDETVFDVMLLPSRYAVFRVE